MKKLAVAGAVIALIATPAFAADMAVKAPPPAPAPVYNWTGWNVGGNIGYGWRNDSVSLSGDNQAGAFIISADGIFVPGSIKTTGAIGGVQLGYNWQLDPRWLASFEADINASGVDGSTTGSATAGENQAEFSTKTRWFGTVRGRLGYLPTDRLLAYATGGLAYGDTKASATNQQFPNTGFEANVLPDGSSFSCGVGAHASTITCLAGSDSRTAVGWTAGAGIEYALWDRWTVKVEYLYVDLGTHTFHMTPVPFAGPPATTGNASIAVGVKDAMNIVRVGLNYQFH